MNHKFYHRNDVILTCTARVSFDDDKAKEVMSLIKVDPEDTIFDLSNKIKAKVNKFRNQKEQNSTDDSLDALGKLPNWFLKIIVAPLFKWLSHTHRGISKLALIRLLGFLPLGHWIDKKTKKSFKIIGLPLFKIKKKQQKTIYFFCGIPIIKIQW